MDVNNINEWLTYDDVLLMPKYSNITSRKQVDTSGQLTKNININVPIVSANMDTVTESSMAIAMARQGGIGIIHRFMSIEEQVNNVRAVKRSEAIVIEKPYTLTPEHIIRDAKNLMKEKNITGILVTDNVGRLVGILTNRDLMFEDNLLMPIAEVMTNKEKLVTAPPNTNIEAAKSIFKQHKIEKLPLVDKNGILRGLITTKDIQKKELHPLASKDKKGRLLVGAAIGVKDDYLERAEAIINEGCDVLVVDIAHGHHENAIRTIKAIRDKFGEVELIAGNVATAEGTLDLIKAGADCIKIGVGPGCFAAGTRILMSNGFYKNIEEVKPGDRVVNKDGNPVTVKDAFCTGVRSVYKIRNSIFYEDTYVTPDHNYFVGDLNTTSIETLHSRGYVALLQVQSKTVPKSSKYKWKEIKDLERDALLMPRNIKLEIKPDFEIILNKRKGGNSKTGIIYKIDARLIPSYELGYLFGLFLGDGSAHTPYYKGSHRGAVNWYLGLNEENIVKKLKECINKLFNKQPRVYRKKNIIKVIFYYKPLADFLDNFGKRKNKALPEQYLVDNEDYLNGLLEGLIDSDGFKEDGGRIKFDNTSKRLIELFSVLNYLLTGVFPNNKKKGISVGKLKNANIENFSTSYVAEIINTGKKRLTEEYQIAKLLERENINLYLKVYDLEVDCPTHSFIANNAIVHNSVCSTRIVTGAGVPQLSAVIECSKVATEIGIPTIADGGIKQSGCITKALAAGASTVMIGNILAGTEESPGQTVIKGGRKFKIYRGMAGFGANISKREKEVNKENVDITDLVPEGVEGTVPYKGSVAEVIYQLVGGLRSGMSYVGAHNIKELWKNAEFIRITPAGLKEGHVHDIDQIK